MKEYRDKRVIAGLLAEIAKKMKALSSPIKIMEVCGTHTMTIHKYGLKKILEKTGVEMISGPGCPVCITPDEIHKAAIDIVANNQNFILATFGDMTRVPTQKGSLQTIVPASGSLVKIVYSPEESLEAAMLNPKKEVVFFGVGFETTIPSIAITAKQAFYNNVPNFSILSALWLIPPPLKALVEAEDTPIQGFLYPGHVSAIIGSHPYSFIAEEFRIPGAITGFEPSDILLGISSILEQIQKKTPLVSNEYARVVKPSGNVRAQKIMEKYLEIKNAFWRGLGLIPKSGLKLKNEYSAYDAEVKFNINIEFGSKSLSECRCGEVLQGRISPSQCPLFGKKCNPSAPLGPCMVSFEGACLAFYKYNRN
ncbi:hydrogenase formation protein HypD [Acidobacteriota bacterium]